MMVGPSNFQPGHSPRFHLTLWPAEVCKIYIAPSWHVKIWISHGKYGHKTLFHTLRLFLRQGNFGFLGDVGLTDQKSFP